MTIIHKQPDLNVKRRSIVLNLEISRVITRPYIPGGDNRVNNVVNRVLKFSEDEVRSLLDSVMRGFSDRHRYLRQILGNNFEGIKNCIQEGEEISEERRLLLGAYFTSEYSVEAAALFNPSIVPHPDQSGLAAGSLRFIMSFRATGEGHISSIEFRSGVIDEHNSVFFDPISKYVETPEIQTHRTYNRHLFRLKLSEMGACNNVANHLLNELGEDFTFNELQGEISELLLSTDFPEQDKTDAIDTALWVARSNYIIKFRPDHRIAERVIFPVSENEVRGIEDARFVRFIDDDGKTTYYATYTAYNGFTILPQLIKTKDFVTFKIITLNGKAVQNKGMALFPRKLNGQYVMLSRQDGENNYIMYSDNLHFWQEAKVIQEPSNPWELVQIGNCGSPVETSEGWLMLTHGVGPMRKYSIGIQLLDLDNPSRIIGRIDEPILTPNEQEREGYVPNVVYTCGAIIHNDELIIPYSSADQRCAIATVNVQELLSMLKSS